MGDAYIRYGVPIAIRGRSQVLGHPLLGSDGRRGIGIPIDVRDPGPRNK